MLRGYMLFFTRTSWHHLWVSETQRRSHFRIVYSAEPRPTLLFSSHTFKVLDVSEAGFRISLGTVEGMGNGDEVSGTLTFPEPESESFIVRGTVTRVESGEASIKLKTPLPLRKIMSEQRRLFAKFEKFE